MNVSDFSVVTLEGANQSLSAYRGQVLLVVNVASECGFTPQYAGLEALYRRYRDKGFSVLGFPCNQFGGQEPGTAGEIREFCTTRYDISFPLFARIEVNGPDAQPLFQHLKHEQKGVLGTEAIKWNFTKFLVDRQGRVVKRYAPKDTPESMAMDIVKLLG